MRLYSGTSRQFIDDTVRNQIADKLLNAYLDYFRHRPSLGEINSWRESLQRVANLFQYANLLDHGVILEYQLPLSSKRLDCLICGRDSLAEDNAVIIELKQWQKCEEADSEREVITWVGGAEREILHPSVQVGQYERYLKDVHTGFYGEGAIKLLGVSYLHNYSFSEGDPLIADKFEEINIRNPLYSADDVDSLAGLLEEKLSEGEGETVLARIENSQYRPSKKLMEHVARVIHNKSEYILLDEQLVVYDKIFSLLKESYSKKNKHAVIIKGGPGTGKSVIAINLMADMLEKDYNAQYATGSKAFTETLRKAIGSRGEVQFKYFNSYMNAEADAVDILISDEAHRIRKSSNNMYTRRENRSEMPQINELLHAGRVNVFFIDDRQVVRPGEVGSVEYIKKSSEEMGIITHEFELETQFRCAGSDKFINWVNNTLGIENNADILFNTKEDFEFKIFDTPFDLEKEIIQKSLKGHSARLTAGFCWDWSKSLTEDKQLYNDVQIGEYKRPWNARPDMTGLPRDIPRSSLWAYDPNGINQIGCIYTAQGFEFDYVGVIWGKDLIYDFNKQKWIGQKEFSADSVVKRSGEEFIEFIKNTYRVLLTRGLKGCYVYFEDEDTRNFVKSRISD